METNPILVALREYKFINENSKVTSIESLQQEEFINIIINIITSISISKGIEINRLPKTLSKDLNMKYKECQIIVDIVKSLSYKSQISLNNLLFPTNKDKTSLIQYLLETLSKEESSQEEVSEKTIFNSKLHSSLVDFINKKWILPCLTNEEKDKNLKFRNLVYFNKERIKELKKSGDFQKQIVSPEVKSQSQEFSQRLYDSLDNSYFYIKQDIVVNTSVNNDEDEKEKLSSQIENGIKNYIKSRKAKEGKEGKVNCVDEILFNREEVINDMTSEIINTKESVFLSKVKLSQNKEKIQVNVNELKENLENETKSDQKNAKQEKEINETKEKEKGSSQVNEVKENKIETLKDIHEKEAKELNEIIYELTNKLQVIENNIDSNKRLYEENIENIQKKEEEIKIKSDEKKNLLQTLENTIQAYENMQSKENVSERDKEIDKEIKDLEQKYNELVTNWEAYSNQVSSEITKIKENMESKRKEYNFKYEKIGVLKREVEELSMKINQKSELRQFLLDEFERITSEFNRNKYILKINELTKIVDLEKTNWECYKSELIQLETVLENEVGEIKRIDLKLEEMFFKDASKSVSIKEVYSVYMKLREGYNKIQVGMIDIQLLKDNIREVSNKLEQYRAKLKNYDIKQLQEQVDLLKKGK